MMNDLEDLKLSCYGLHHLQCVFYWKVMRKKGKMILQLEIFTPDIGICQNIMMVVSCKEIPGSQGCNHIIVCKKTATHQSQENVDCL